MNCENSVTVSPQTITLKVGDWFTDTEISICVNDKNTTLTWYSENPTVASVNTTSGYIHANSAGTAKIYAVVYDSVDGVYESNYITVKVIEHINVEAISLNTSAITIEKGKTTTLSATCTPSNASNTNVTWTSSNSNVAQVVNGVVTGISTGTATITATSVDDPSKTATCLITVTTDILVTSITLSPRENDKYIVNNSIYLDRAEYLIANVEPQNAVKKSVTWSSDNSNIATVNPTSGLVQAISLGTTVIRATAKDGSCVVGTFDLTVKEPIYVEDIKITPSPLVIYKGNTRKLTACISPDNATTKKLYWYSSNNLVVSINKSTNTITARSAGKATIYAVALDGSKVAGCCNITVKQTATTPTEQTPTSKVKGSYVADPVDIYTGAHVLSNTLMSLFGGQNIKLIANYNSTLLSCGLLGRGWYLNYEKHLEINESDAFVYNTPSTFSCYTASNTECTSFTCCSPDKNGYILTVDHSREYPYIIDCNSARTEFYNSNGDLAKIRDHQGFEILISYTDSLITITDCVSNKHINLEKDSKCRIVRIYDDADRNVTLTYSTCNMLTSITDVRNNTISYTYDEDGRVLSGKDSLNIIYFQNTYDEFGRVATQKDALNHISSFDYSENACESCEGDTRVTTDRNGHKSCHIYNCDGLLIKLVDQNGNITRYEYDERYNVTKEIDANGNSVTKEYNRFNKPTKIIDKNGNITNISYDDVGNVTHIVYPEIDGNIPKESFTYNEHNQLYQHTDIRGTVTTYTYDANGMPETKKVGNRNPITYHYINGLLKSQTDALGHTTSYDHNYLGQVISMTDAKNNVTEYQYDSIGNLLCTIDPTRKSVESLYDGNNQKTYSKDANGNVTEYSYNGNMKNDIITLPDGHTIRYEFDPEDRVKTITDQRNNVTEITYDAAGRVISKKTLIDNAITKYEYDKVGNVIKETNPKGAIVTKTYDKLGNVLTVTDNEGNTTTYEYNAMNKVTKMTNAVAGTTIYTYSKAGDLLSETDALGNKKTYTYDAFGNRLTATDAKNNVTTYTYDQNNNLLTVKDALNHITTYTYNTLNQCETVKDARNHIITYGYDALGRKTSIKDARGNTFTTVYDGNGNITKTIDAKGNTISETAYNEFNKPLTVKDAMNKTTTYTYNELGLIETVTDTMNHVSEYSYNSRGQIIAALDALNGTSEATYDLLGNVTRLAGPLGGATEYTYDDMGRLTSESTVSGGTKSYGYNELNVRNQVTNAREQVRKIFYDAKGRISGYISPEGPVSYIYDQNDNVLTVIDKNGSIHRTYDALNRVSSYTDTYGKLIRYEYDEVGNLSKIVYPDNTCVTYNYDENNNLSTVTDWANRVTSYAYDENNRLIGVIKPDGSVTTTIYDNKQRVTSTVEKTAGGVVITGFEYIYDDLSRIIEEKVLANSTKMCYTYDNLSRITARTVKKLSDNSVVSTETFNYDAAGNVTSAPDSSFQYDTNNRLISFNGNTVSYDLDGNMLSNGFLTCTYDSANRLVTAGGHTYTYNAEDIRIRNLCANNDTTYSYDTNCKLSRLLCKTTNEVVTKYVYGKGLIGEEIGNAFKTYHFDARGSTTAITDINGHIIDAFAYDTYGTMILHSGSSEVIFLFGGIDGIISDANGLCYMRARYYSPEMKRFVNSDIVAGEISNSVTLNRFAYANGNPVSFVDPIGLSLLLTLGLIALGAVIGGTVSAVSSAVEQKKENGEVNWKEVAVDAAWGALNGGISASPLGFVGKTIASGVISAGQSITDQYFDSDNKEEFDLSDVDYLEVGTSVAIDVGFSMLEIKKPNKIEELNKVVSALDDKIARETRRANKEVAQKRIAEASLKKSNAIQGAITDMLIDPFTPKQIAQNSVEFVVDKLFFDNDEETYSRK